MSVNQMLIHLLFDYTCSVFFFFKQKTAYDMRISDWSSDVCSSDLLTMEQKEPALIWIADNTPRSWFGHVFPGDVIAGDNPDNSNRVSYIDGDSSYVLVGRYGKPKSGQFSLNVEMAHPAGGMGQHLATLTDKQITLEPDGTFRVTIDSKPINGRSNNLPVSSARFLLAARDRRSHGTLQATPPSLRLGA